MPLEHLIDLIAEVAAKRAAREGKTKADTPDAAESVWRTIRAARWNGRHILVRIYGFARALDSR
ncbi:hypothetical protein C2I36_15390 [Rhodobacteraceae bacterium WD3A24]|nr:hypothetical protein C2I36_15390 [Rhodobacteraceae bacterium WD3A24]